MNVIKPSTPYGYSIFHDDYRNEGSGKFTLIGVHTGPVCVKEFPFEFESLCVSMTYIEPPTESNEPVQIVITAPGEEWLKYAETISREEFASFEEATVVEKEDSECHPVTFIELGARLRRLVVPEPGLIKVRAYRGDDEIRMGTLAVCLDPAVESSDVASSHLAAPPLEPPDR